MKISGSAHAGYSKTTLLYVVVHNNWIIKRKRDSKSLIFGTRGRNHIYLCV